MILYVIGNISLSNLYIQQIPDKVLLVISYCILTY